MSGLTIGSLTLSPFFDPLVLEYSATTTAATNKITAVAAKPDAVISIAVNGKEQANGATATWQDGVNALNITVAHGTTVRVYTVAVTKSMAG